MGSTSETGERYRQAGFTLIEILVVLMIVGLLGSFVLLAAPIRGESVTGEAERLAARLTRAKEEALLTNRTIEVRITPEGYGFDMRRGAERLPLQAKSFAGVNWDANTTAMFSALDGQSRIIFDPTGSATPATLDLVRADSVARVLVDASGQVRVDARPR